MTKTTYKVGDKIRILDANGIINADVSNIQSGGIYEVIELYNGRDWDPMIKSPRGGKFGFLRDELQYIEKVEESDAKMTQFKVGDKVRVINANASKHSNGDEGVVVSITPIWDVVFYDVDVNGMQQGHYDKDIELVSPKLTKNQRITTLESEVAELKAKVEALEKAEKPSLVYEGSAQFINGERAIKVAPTYNEQRKAIIAEAKAFVATKTHYLQDSPKVKGGWAAKERENPNFCDYLMKEEFIVNTEKRTVVALIRYEHGSDLKANGIAKCAPDDVFNEHIGKAIALGRALGLDVSKFEKAVQPTEFAVGQITLCGLGIPYTITEVREDRGMTKPGTFHWKSELRSGVVKITNDTEAQY